VHKNIKLIKYIGKSDKLVHGKFYTYKELSEIAGVTQTAMRNRIGKHTIIDDNKIFPKPRSERKKTHFMPTLETPQERLSDMWMRRSL